MKWSMLIISWRQGHELVWAVQEIGQVTACWVQIQWENKIDEIQDNLVFPGLHGTDLDPMGVSWPWLGHCWCLTRRAAWPQDCRNPQGGSQRPRPALSWCPLAAGPQLAWLREPWNTTCSEIYPDLKIYGKLQCIYTVQSLNICILFCSCTYRKRWERDQAADSLCFVGERSS